MKPNDCYAYPTEAQCDPNVSPENNYLQTGIYSGKFSGMTLRDYFAAHAPEPPVGWWGWGGEPTCSGYSMWNYQFADLMLKERLNENII